VIRKDRRKKDIRRVWGTFFKRLNRGRGGDRGLAISGMRNTKTFRRTERKKAFLHVISNSGRGAKSGERPVSYIERARRKKERLGDCPVLQNPAPRKGEGSLKKSGGNVSGGVACKKRGVRTAIFPSYNLGKGKGWRAT